MSNLTDALIAAKLMNGGGSGGRSGLPEITTETVEVVAEQTVAFSSGGGGISVGGIEGDFSINVGDTLIVNWDGTPYTCVVTEFYGSPTWGNFSIEGAGADTGEPFLMGATPGRGIEMETLSGGTHTIQIASEKTNYPDGSILVAINGEWAKAEGYGYEKEGTVTLIADKYLPKLITAQGTPAASVTIAANASEEVQVSNSVTETGKRYQVMAMTVGTGGSLYYLQPIGIGRAVPGALSINAYNTTGASKTLSTSTVIELLLQELSF